jgi:hypothetical protein
VNAGKGLLPSKGSASRSKRKKKGAPKIKFIDKEV